MQQQGQMKSIVGDTRPLSNNKRPYRKTSAEIVSEAKSILAGGGTGARLVATRRPITPREPRPGRHLYGRVAPEGRPPSAFSLRYLQFESRALPSLEPIPQITQSFDDGPASPARSPTVQRSESTGSLCGCHEGEDTNNNQKRGKLPALLQPPKIAASLDNLLEEMPPRKDHPLRKMQTKSCDGNLRSDGPQKLLGTPQSHVGVRGTKLNRANDLLTQSSTDTLLDMLKAHAGVKECTDESVQHITGILTELYTRVKGARGGWRGAVLTALYGLVECASPKVLLSVARVVLALRVTGSNLTGACKLIFKVARNESNDNLFIDCDVAELLIEGLGRASPLEEPEACIYGYGAVRFLATSNPQSSGKSIKKEVRYKSLAYRLARHGAIDLMVLHLQMLNEAGAQSKLAGPPLHALYQLSGALRALAGAPIVIHAINNPTAKVLTTTQTTQFGQIKETLEGEEIQLELAGPHLVRAAEICIDETETQANVIRTLSVLSELDVCCGVMVDSAAKLAILLGPWPEDRREIPEKALGIVSRLGYILGNIVARWDMARILIYENDVAMEHLVAALEHYSNQSLQARGQGEDSVADVIVKLVRVVANMCVNGDVGSGMCRKPCLGSTLLNVIMTTNSIPADQMTEELEEMLLATLGALHNLSFYQEGDEKPSEDSLSSVNGKIEYLSCALVETLKSQSIASQAEAARVLGNMTRNPECRTAICSAGGLKVLVRNLESEDFELVSSSCGVLVNLLGDWERRAPFKELKGPLLLRDVLQRSAMEEDWLLAGIVCQALWNFLIDTENVVSALGTEEAEYIMQDLVECLGEEKKKIQCADELWEQFSFVAGDLLDRIQAAPISITNSPCISSESDDNDVVVGGKVGQAWGNGFRQWLDE